KTIGLGAFDNAQETTLIGNLDGTHEGKTWYNSQTNEIKYWNGSAAVVLGTAGAGLGNFNGQTGNTQTLDIVTNAGGAVPAWSSDANTHSLLFPNAASPGVDAGLLSKNDYDAFAGKQDALGFV